MIGLALSELHVSTLYDDGGRLMRTPLNSSGPISFDVLSGICSFVKEGTLVEPAICHFCGEWVNHPSYLIAQQELQTGRPVSAGWAYATRLAYNGRQVAAKLGGRMRRLRQAKLA